MTSSLWRHTYISFQLLLLALLNYGCNDIPADNPFDPQAPPSVQALGNLKVLIRFPVTTVAQPEIGQIRLLRSDTNLEVDSLPISEASPVEQADGEENKTYSLSFRDVAGGSYILEPLIQGYITSIPTIVNVQIGAEVEALILLTNAPIPDGPPQGLTGKVLLDLGNGLYRDNNRDIRVAVKDNQEYEVFTDASGNFDLFLPTGTWVIEVSKGDYKTIELTDINIDGEMHSLSEFSHNNLSDDILTLDAKSGSLKGLVRLTCVNQDASSCQDGFQKNNEFLEQIKVCARPITDSNPTPSRHCDETTTDTDDEEVLKRATLEEWNNADGLPQGRSVLIDELNPGDYILVFTHPNYKALTREVSILPNQLQRVDEVHLDPISLEDNPNLAVTISGLIRVDGQLNSGGVTVKERNSGDAVDSLTNGEFSIVLAHNPAGYELEFNKPNYLPVTRDVPAIERGARYRFADDGDAPIVEIVGAPGSIRGSLRLQSRTPDDYVSNFEIILNNTTVCARLDQGEEEVASNCDIDLNEGENLILANSVIWLDDDDVPKGQRFVFEPIPAGRYKVIYTNSGYDTATQSIEIGPGDTGRLNQQDLVPTTEGFVTITGHVLLEDQSDFGGITVDTDDPDNPDNPVSILAVETINVFLSGQDRNTGGYSINLPHNVQGYNLTFFKVGFRREVRNIDPFPRGEVFQVPEVTLAVIPARINGQVLIDPEAILQITSSQYRVQERELIDAAQVKIFRLQGDGLPEEVATSGLTLNREGIENDDPTCIQSFPPAVGCSQQTGTFSFQDLSIGEYQIQVELDAFVSETRPFSLSPNQTLPLGQFFLTQSIQEATITGRVLYPCLGGCDHSGIQVSAGGYTALTGTDGNFRLVVNAVPVPYQVNASREGYQQKLLGEVTIEAGATRSLEEQTLDAQPGRISGLISLPPRFDPSRYMEEVIVTLRSETAAEGDSGATESPNVNGNFSFDSVSVGDYTLSVESPGFVPVILTVQMGPGEIRSLNMINLYSTDTEIIQGLIRLEGVGGIEGHGDTSILLINTPFSTLSNADGSFILQGVPGDGRLRIAKVGYESRTIEFEDLRVEELRDLGEIELAFEPATINGIVNQLNAQDQSEPAVGAILSLSRTDGIDGTPRDETEGIPAFISGNDGQYSSPELLGGSYTLTVSMDGYVTETRVVDLPLGSSISIDDITLDLERGSIAGTARRENISTSGGITVRVQSLSDGAIDGVIDRVQLTGAPDDRFSFTRLPIGSYRVEAFVDGYQPTLPVAVIVNTDEETSTSLTLTPREYSLAVPSLSQSTTIEATLGGDTDLSFYRFRLDSDPNGMSAWFIRPDGIVNLTGLSEGTHTVFFELATQSFVAEVVNDPSAYKSPIMSASFRVDTVSPEIGQVAYSLPSGASSLTQENQVVAYQETGSAAVALINALDPTPASGIVNAQVESLDDQGQVLSTVIIPFTPILQLSAALPAGFNQYRVQLIDAAGNESEATMLSSIMGDSQAPTGTLSRLSDQQTRVVNVTLQLDYQDADASPLFYRLYQTDQSPGAWQSLPSGPDPVALNFALTPGDSGDRIVTGDIRDAAGRVTALNEITYRYDNRSSSPPQVLLNQGEAWTNVSNIEFSITDPSAADNEANGNYTLIIEGEVEEAGEYAYAQIPDTLTLSGAEDGEKRLSFMWVDGAGNRSPQTETSISIDRVIPAFASVNLIEPEGRRRMLMTLDGVDTTILFMQTEDSVVCTLSGFDPTPSSDLVSVEVITCDETGNELVTNTYAYSALLELSPTANVAYRSYKLTVIDAAGNRSQTLETTMVKGDLSAPTGSLALNGTSTQNNTLFTFELSVDDTDESPLAYRLYQNDQTPGVWVDLNLGTDDILIPFTVSGGTSGDRTISGQLKDAGGRITQLNDVTVRYDVNASNAPDVSLDDGSIWTTDLSVELAVTPPVAVDAEANGGYSLMIEGEIELNEVGVYEYQTIPDRLTLIDGEDGIRQVSFTWIDSAGNHSVQTTEMITLDRVSPQFSALSIAQPEGSQRITVVDNGNTVNTVYLKTDDAVVAIISALDPAPSSDLALVEVITYLENGAEEETQSYAYSAVLELAPAASEGIRSYGITLVDSAGNRSAPLNTDLVKGDASSPTGSLAINGSNVSNSTLFTIDLSVDDTDESRLSYRLYQEDQTPGSWVDIDQGVDSLSVPFTVTAGQTGSRLITGELRDASGRVTTLNTVTVTYDITQSDAPEVTLNGGAIWTTDLSVALAVAAPASSDIEASANYTLVIAGQVQETGEYAYDDIPVNLTLTDGNDGLRNVRFTWIDGANNRSIEANIAISLDRVIPTFSAVNLNQPEGSRLITVTTEDQGVSTTTSTQYLKIEDAVIAILSANDPSPSSDIKSIEVATYDDGDTLLSTDTYDYTTVLEVSPTAIQAFRRYELTLIDSAGNRSDSLSTVWVKGDQSDPTGRLAIDGDSNSASTLFSLTLDVADDDSSPISYRLYQTDQSPGAWFNIDPGNDSLNIPFTVTAGSTGDRTITGEIMDAAGRTVSLNQVTVRYDVTSANPPEVSLNQGNEWTSTLQVAISVTPPTSPDGEAGNQHHFFILGQSRDTGSYAVGQLPNSLRLSPGSDGVRVVGFGWMDQAGNRSEITEVSLLVDREPPSVREFVLGDASGYTTSRSIDFSFTCIDNMAAESELVMNIQSPLENSIIDVDNVAYSSPYELTLDPQVGSQAITVRCMDAAGNFRERSGNEDLNGDGNIEGFEAIDNLKIYYDNIPPAQNTFDVANGVNGVSVSSQTVSVTTSFIDIHSGIEKVAVSEEIQDCSTASYIYPAVGEFQFLLSDLDGSRRLSLCAMDIAGNILGPVQSNLVELDRIDPNFTVTIDNGSGWSSDRTLLLTLNSTDDDTTDYLVDVTGDLEDSVNISWPNNNTIEVLLSEGHGEKQIIINVYDAAGNQGTTIQESVILDDKAPDLFTATLSPESQFSSSRNVDVAVNCVDDYANPNELTLKIEHVGQVGHLYNGVYVPLVTGLDVLDGEGDRVLKVNCVDPAANHSVFSIIDFAVDTIAPSASNFSLSGLGPAGTSRSLQLTATIEASDATSGLKKLALFEDGNTTCEDASYLTSINPTRDYGITLSAGEGTRTVYLCLQDNAGNQTADRLSATIDIDTTPPSQGDLLINNGDEFTNNVEVELDVTALEAAANLMVRLNGNFIGGQIDVNLVDFPINVNFTDRNGIKNIQAILRDQAGNQSPSFSASIRLDTNAPEDGKVAYNFVAINNNPTDIQDLTIPLSIQDTIASTMQFWEVASQDQCGDLACDDHGDEVFSANTSFTVSGGDGEKRICWRFCDEAGNASNTGTGLFDLNQEFVKPRPVLNSITPEEYTTYSMVNESMTLPVLLNGSDIAASTQVQLGDYLYNCESVTRGRTVVQPNDCTQNQRGLCGTQCTINLSLTDGILKFPGRYFARLITPDPIFEGVGTSAAELFFTVKAPPPTITSAGTHGAVRETMISNQNLTLNIVACGVVDNATFTFADQNGSILEINEVDESDNCDRFTVSFEVGGLNPYIDLPYMLKVVNPSPGGGFSEFPFALTPPFIECPLFENCVYTLHNILPSAGLNTSLIGASMTYLQPDSFAVKGSSVVGADAVTITDRFRNVLSTIDLKASGGALPLIPEINICSPNVPNQLCPLNNLSEFQRLITVEDHRESASQALLYSVQRKDIMTNKSSGELRRYIGCNDEPAGKTERLAGGVNRFALGDIDHDGDLDIVTAHKGAGEVQIRLGAALNDIKLNGISRTNACNQDLNGDGQIDDCTLYAFTPMLLGTETPLANQLEQPRILMGEGAYDVTLADLNQDGVLDIITPDSEANSISIRYGYGDGSFGARTVINTDAEGPIMVKVADMNQDGWSDLIVAFCGLSIHSVFGAELCDATKGGVRVYLGNKLNQYQVDTSRSLTGAIHALDIGDLNHDGALDIVASNRDSVELFFSTTINGSVSAENPWMTHSLIVNPNFNVGFNKATYDVQVSDWNGDGSLDVIFTLSQRISGNDNSNYNGNFIGILLNDGTGQYAELSYNENQALTEVYSIEALLLGLNASHPACKGSPICAADLLASHFTIGEFTGDGRPDIAIALFGTIKGAAIREENNWVAIIAGGEQTRLDPTQVMTHNTLPIAANDPPCSDYLVNTDQIANRSMTRISDIQAIDLDGDGAQELIAISSDAESEYQLLGLNGAIIGWRGGHFPNIQAAPTGPTLGKSYPVSYFRNLSASELQPYAVQLHDVDNDNDLDVIWQTEFEDDKVVVKLNENGMLRSLDETDRFYGQNGSTGLPPIPFSVGDVDNSGSKEIVVAQIGIDLNGDFNDDNGFAIYRWNASSISKVYPSSSTGIFVNAANNPNTNLKLYSVQAVENLGGNSVLDRGVLVGVTESVVISFPGEPLQFGPSYHVYLYQKNGSTFTLTESLNVSGSHKIVTGQVNQDQYTDVISIGNGIAHLMLASGNFSGTSYFASNTAYPMTDGIILGATLADLDGDGDLDLIALSENNGEYTLSARLNTGVGFGNPADPAYTLSQSRQMVSLKSVDMNQDQYDDLVIANGTSDSATIMYGPFNFTSNNQNFRFNNAGRLTVPMGRNVRDLHFGDINQDGSIDLISANGSPPIDENGIAGEALTVWSTEQASRWRESVTLRSQSTALPTSFPNVNEVILPNTPRYIEKATLSLTVEGTVGRNSVFSVTLTSPEEQTISFEDIQLSTEREHFIFALTLDQKWQRGVAWTLNVDGASIIDAKLNFESWFKRPNYEQSPCTASLEGEIRLIDTRLEICHANVWGTVCDDSPASNTIFDAEAIDVICQSFGFDQGEQMAASLVPDGTGTIWLDDVDCIGTESSITECTNRGFGVENCDHDEDVGIRCF